MPEPKTTAASSENLAEFVERLESACVAMIEAGAFLGATGPRFTNVRTWRIARIHIDPPRGR